jgi:predicted dehydrogenase
MNMNTKNPKSINRRGFIRTSSLALAGITILPRPVLGGPGYVAPSDKLTLAYIGCGPQGLSGLITLIANPEVQIVAVCDPEKFAENYLEFASKSLLNNIRRVLEKPSWGEAIRGVPGGRDVGKEIVDTYYAKDRSTSNYKGCSMYSDFRELLEKEKDLDSVRIITPDHQHAAISIAAMKKGKHVVMHKPLANRVYESRLVVETARRTGVSTHLLAYQRGPDPFVKEMLKGNAIGTLREVHNWTDRAFWPAYHSVPTDRPPVPKDFDWDIYLGPVLDRPYHPHYTHGVYRGWYDFGAGAIADMGFYSLWPIFETLSLPVPSSVEALVSTDSVITDQVSAIRVNDFSFPNASQVRFRFPAIKTGASVPLYWYDGGMKPYTPEALEVDGNEMPVTGTMYLGDKGAIVGNQIYPEKLRRDYLKNKDEPPAPVRGGDNLWIQAFRGGTPSPGSFTNAANCGEAICLAGAAIRYARKSFKTIFTPYTTPVLQYDSKTMKITNVPEANQYLTREYRKGWEL